MPCHLWTRRFVKVLKIFLAITFSVGLLTSCQKKSGPSASVGGGSGGGGNTSEGEIEYEVSGTIANEEPVEFVQAMDSVEISGVNLATSTQYHVKAFYLNPSGKKIQIHESVFNSNRFEFKAKVPKHLIIIEAVRMSDGGKFAGLLPPPMRKILAKLRMNRTTSIAAKMASIIADKASSGDSAAKSALASNSISVADVVTVAQSVRLAVDAQKAEDVGSPIDLTSLASKLVEKSNERLAALTSEGQNPEDVAEKLSEKTYSTVFGDKAEEISPAILAHRTNYGLGSSAAATTDVAYETIKSLSTPAAKQLDEAFRVEAEAYRKASDLSGAVTAESTVSSVYAPKFTACITGSPDCAAKPYVPPLPPVLLLGSVSAPVASPQAGIYTSGQAVTLSTSTAGATIYYTVDGSSPTTVSTLYSNPIAILVDQTIKAIAVKDGYSPSSESSHVYSITGTVATPTFSVPQGSYGPEQSVTLSSATPGATIHYTTNNTAPTAESTQYSGAITVSTSQTIRAIAVLTNWSNSAEASAVYTINGAVAAPTTDVPVGAYGPTQSVTLSSATSGASIRYTTGDGTQAAPTCSTGSTSMPISVSATATIKAIACRAGYSDSSVTSFEYTINGAVAVPTTDVPVGEYGPAQSVTLSSATSGASIRYTTGDGTQAAPTCSTGSTSMPISVSATATIKATACRAGYSDSSVVPFAYTINGAVAAPAFSVPEGSYGPAQTVSITTTTSGAVIYYTTNGTDPTTSSDVYSGALTVSSTTTIKAMAVMLGYSNSTVSSASYTINGAVANPTTNVPVGEYGPTQSVTLSSATSGASIYYNIGDGKQADPTCSTGSTSMPISVSATATIKAIACKAGYSDSSVMPFAYTINGAAAAPAFSVPEGSYGPAQTISITTITSGAVIYYTTNGTDPTTSSDVYSGALTVSSTTTIKAMAVMLGYSNSTVSSATYTINGAVATPTTSVESGTYTSAQLVELSSSTPGATIYYTIDGSTPNISSTTYSVPISVTATQTIKAIATKANYVTSGEGRFDYTITAPEPIYKHSFNKAIGDPQQSISTTNISGGVIDAGDTLVAVVMTRSDVTSVSPGAWTRLGSSSGVQRDYLQRVSVYYKIATGDPAVDNTVTVSQVDNARIILSVLVFRGRVEPRDIQSGAPASDCDRVGMPAIATLGALEVPVYTYTNAFTYTHGSGEPAAEVATFYNQADAADPNLSKDAPAGNNRMTVAIGQMGTNSQITSAGFNSCGVGVSQQGMRFVVSKFQASISQACAGDCYLEGSAPNYAQDLAIGTERQGPISTILTLQYANGSSGFKIWTEKGGTRILNASGFVSNGWQKQLTRSGTAFSSNDFTISTNVAGRVCPTHVFLSHSNMTATNRCVYYDNNDVQVNYDSAGGIIGEDQLVNADHPSSGRGTNLSYYEGNIKTCADKGMRLPTMYETVMTKPMHNLPQGDNGISPIWAGSVSGVPSLNSGSENFPSGLNPGTATASANSANNGTEAYFIWSGTVTTDSYYSGAPFNKRRIRCVVPNSSNLPPPAIASVSPDFAAATPGTVVTITGTGFVSGATVSIGSVPVTSVTFVSSTSIQATIPAGASGAKSLVITNTDGQNASIDFSVIGSVDFADTTNGATLPGTTPNGAAVSGIYFGPSAYSLSMATGGSWEAVSAIFSGSSELNTTNRPNKGANSGSTWNTNAAGSYMVIDLGQNRTFSKAFYYQMFSDGKTTHASMDVSSSLLSYDGAGWTSVHLESKLANGNNNIISSRADMAVSFAPVTARYIRLKLRNDGSYGDSGYTELFKIKIFE